ncbi:MAG: tetratricopeptide repeat protein [Bacteroidota bacterium]
MRKIFLLFMLLLGVGSYSQSSMLEIESALDQGKLVTAKKLLHQRVSENPNDATALAYLGDIAGFEKDWDSSMALYKNLVQTHPDNAEYSFKYGAALGMKALSISKIQSVIYISDIKKYLEKAVELDSKHVQARRVLVELYIKLPGILGGSLDKAQEFANDLESLNKVDYFLAQAFILKEEEGLAESEVFFKKALEAHQNLASHKRRNILNYELGKAASDFEVYPQYGLKLLNEYIANFGYNDIYPLEWAYYNKAKLQAALMNKSEAIISIDKALTLRGNFKEAELEKKRILRL